MNDGAVTISINAIKMQMDGPDVNFLTTLIISMFTCEMSNFARRTMEIYFILTYHQTLPMRQMGLLLPSF